MTGGSQRLLWLCTIRLKEAELPRLMGLARNDVPLAWIATALSRLAMTRCQQGLLWLCIPETGNLRFHSGSIPGRDNSPKGSRASKAHGPLSLLAMTGGGTNVFFSPVRSTDPPKRNTPKAKFSVKSFPCQGFSASSLVRIQIVEHFFRQIVFVFPKEDGSGRPIDNHVVAFLQSDFRDRLFNQ